MNLHLYRPVVISRAGRAVCVVDANDVSPREAALLVRLRLATWVGESNLPSDDWDRDVTTHSVIASGTGLSA